MRSIRKLNSLSSLRYRPALLFFLFGLPFALSTAAGAAQAFSEKEIQIFREDGAVNLAIRLADGKSVLRFSCLNGESLFISLLVADGAIRSPDIRSALPETGQSFGWLAWHPGMSNIIYAAQPRELLRSLLQYPGARLVFQKPGQAPAGFVFGPFDQKGLTAALPLACQ